MGATAESMPEARLPDFIVIGAMKSATTTLYDYLASHPNVFKSAQKEPMFFSRDQVYEKGIGWYQGLFEGAGPDQLCGEASTCYTRRLRYPEAATRLARHVPGAKLIYIMRHPVDRVYSHYGHTAQERWLASGGKTGLSLETFLERDPEGEEALDASDYMRQIEAYLPLFPREHLLLLTLDQFRADERATLCRVQEFLGLRPLDLLQTSGQVRSNTRGSVISRRKFRNILRGVGRLPVISQIAAMAGAEARVKTVRALRQFFFGVGVGERLSADFERTLDPLTPEIRARLLAHFRTSTRKLEEYLGEDLSSWYR